jgi:hypothetical protein
MRKTFFIIALFLLLAAPPDLANAQNQVSVKGDPHHDEPFIYFTNPKINLIWDSVVTDWQFDNLPDKGHGWLDLGHVNLTYHLQVLGPADADGKRTLSSPQKIHEYELGWYEIDDADSGTKMPWLWRSWYYPDPGLPSSFEGQLTIHLEFHQAGWLGFEDWIHTMDSTTVWLDYLPE